MNTTSNYYKEGTKWKIRKESLKLAMEVLVLNPLACD